MSLSYKNVAVSAAVVLAALLVVAAVLVMAALLTSIPANAMEGRLMRYPDIHGGTVVFTYEDDLWSAPVDGGAARRLTSHPGIERYAKFSPDGEKIAFSASYDGGNDVYVIPAEGGEPKRLTLHPARDRVVGWSRDGEYVLFISFRTLKRELYRVSLTGSFPEKLPLDMVAYASMSPDGKKIAINRFSTDRMNWKGYKGGAQQDIWIAKTDGSEFTRITRWEGYDNFPMWHGGQIYFNSDRKDGRMNIYSYDIESSRVTRCTKHKQWDVEFPSLGGDKIVYCCEGYLWVYDILTAASEKLTIEIPSDRWQMRDMYIEPGGYIQELSLDKTGDRCVVQSRGDIYLLNQDTERAVNITRTQGSRELHPAISPTSDTLAFFSDKSGEYQLYISPLEPGASWTQITSALKTYFYHLKWSPDGQKILFGDKDYTIYLADIETKEIKKIDRCRYQKDNEIFWEVSDYNWSPDSKWVVYSKVNENLNNSIYLYSLESGQSHRITCDRYDDYSPCFDTEGENLYFLSLRNFSPQLDWFMDNNVNADMSEIMVAQLQEGQKPPFGKKGDEEDNSSGGDNDSGKGDESKPGDAGANATNTRDAASKDTNSKSSTAQGVALQGEYSKGTTKEDTNSKKTGSEQDKANPKGSNQGGSGKDSQDSKTIDIQNIQKRVFTVPVKPGTYRMLSYADGHINYLSRENYGFPGLQEFFHPRSVSYYDLHRFNVKKKEDAIVLTDIGYYTLSGDGKKAGYMSMGIAGIVKTSNSHTAGDGMLDWYGLEYKVDVLEEYPQIYRDVWRQIRDFFYDPDLHGKDWQKIYDKYKQLIPYVATRADMNYIIGHMIGELSASHEYIIHGGGPPRTYYFRVRIGLLGADLVPDHKSGRYRFEHILEGKNWNEDYKNPLRAPHIELEEGDYLLAIDNKEITTDDNYFRYLENRAGDEITITVGSSPDTEERKTYHVKTLHSEYMLRYKEWVEKNYRRVRESTGGRVGYMHLADMDEMGLGQFEQAFRAERHRDGLIIDVRDNGGGFVSWFMMDKLERELAFLTVTRDFHPMRYPHGVHRGPIVVICDEGTGSDGEVFTRHFKELGLGTVIGKPTWGGLIGIINMIPLTDGGMVTQSNVGFASLNGEWIVENKGAHPDIIVNNDPAEVVKGNDQQLEMAIKLIMKELEDNPPQQLKPPPFPDKQLK
jgi:tricorn protease